MIDKLGRRESFSDFLIIFFLIMINIVNNFFLIINNYCYSCFFVMSFLGKKNIGKMDKIVSFLKIERIIYFFVVFMMFIVVKDFIIKSILVFIKFFGVYRFRC